MVSKQFRFTFLKTLSMLSTVLFLASLRTKRVRPLFLSFYIYVVVQSLEGSWPCYSKVIQVNTYVLCKMVCHQVLIYHKYLASIIHFDLLNSLLKENIIRMIRVGDPFT